MGDDSFEGYRGDRDFVLLEFKSQHSWEHWYILIIRNYADIGPTTLSGPHSQVQSSEENFTEI